MIGYPLEEAYGVIPQIIYQVPTEHTEAQAPEDGPQALAQRNYWRQIKCQRYK